MATSEDDRPAKKPRHEIGQDLAALSVEELKFRIADLRDEIARIERELGAKDTTRNAAEALFGRRG